MKTKEEKLKLIDETVEFYKTHARCVKMEVIGNEVPKQAGCFYYREDKPHGCAVGRLFKTEEERVAFQTMLNNNSSMPQGVKYIEVYSNLPSYIKEWGQNFLRNLQFLHDYILDKPENNEQRVKYIKEFKENPDANGIYL